MFRNRKYGRQQGMTLLEVVVALLILGIASIALIQITSMSTTSNARSRERAAAVALGIDKMEELREQGYDRLEAPMTGSDSVTAGGVAGGTFGRSWSVSLATLDGVPQKMIDVTVTTSDEQTVAVSTRLAGVPHDYATGFPAAFIKSWNQEQ